MPRVEIENRLDLRASDKDRRGSLNQLIKTASGRGGGALLSDYPF